MTLALGERHCVGQLAVCRTQSQTSSRSRGFPVGSAGRCECPGRLDLRVPALGVEDLREHGRTVVAGLAEPANRPIAVNQRSRVAVGQQAVVAIGRKPSCVSIICASSNSPTRRSFWGAGPGGAGKVPARLEDWGCSQALIGPVAADTRATSPRQCVRGGGERLDLFVRDLGEVSAEHRADPRAVVLEHVFPAWVRLTKTTRPSSACRSRFTRPRCSSCLTMVVVVGGWQAPESLPTLRHGSSATPIHSHFSAARHDNAHHGASAPCGSHPTDGLSSALAERGDLRLVPTFGVAAPASVPGARGVDVEPGAVMTVAFADEIDLVAAQQVQDIACHRGEQLADGTDAMDGAVSA